MKYVCQIQHSGTARPQHYRYCSVRQVTSTANTHNPPLQQFKFNTEKEKERESTDRQFIFTASSSKRRIAHRTDGPLCRVFSPLNARQNAPKLLSIETKMAKKKQNKTTLAHTTATRTHSRAADRIRVNPPHNATNLFI